MANPNTLTTVGTLSDLLPTECAEKIQLQRLFFNQPAAFLHDGWQLRFSYSPEPLGGVNELVDLQQGEDLIELGMTFDATSSPLGDQQWQDFAWESRLMAWTCAHEDLLQRLSLLFGDLLPTGMRKTQTLASRVDQMLWLRLDVANSERLIGSGSIGVPWHRVSALRQALPATEVNDRLASLSIDLPIRLRGPRLTLHRATAMTTTSVIVLGDRRQALEQAKITVPNEMGTIHLSARWSSSRLTICKQLTATVEEAELMSDSVSSTAIPDAEPSAINTDAIPIELELEIGRVRVSLAELREMQPGYVLDLAQPVTGAKVDIIANRAVIGTGELVAAGNTLGIRVLSWTNDGLQ